MLRLKEKYNKKVLPAMMKKFSYANVMAVPKIKKAVLNIGFGKKVSGKTGKERKKIEKSISDNLILITGQKPVLTSARKSISGFKLRRGMVVGAKVTLRGQRMYDFLDKLIHVVLPRSRDFRGINQNSVSQRGNLTIGIREHIIFPEISTKQLQKILSLEVTIETTAKNKEQGLILLKLLGFPIKMK